MKHILLMLFIMLQYFSAKAQLQVHGLDTLRNVMMNCSMDYTLTCIYPGGQVYNITGKLATQGSNFYDSSNVRYVFLNKNWYIVADHIERIVSVAYIKEINKDLEGIGAISASSYLFSDNSLLGIDKIDVVKQNADTSWMNVKFKDSLTIERLELQLLRNSMTPVKYSAVINYPYSEFGGDDNSTVKLEISCFNIQSPAPLVLFDDKRLVSVKGKQATLKKFNTYKTYK